MPRSLEIFRREELREGDPLFWHPMNQAMASGIRDRRRRGYDRKAENAEKRRLREEEFLKNLPHMQFHRALGRMFEGTATPEDIKYVFRHADELGPTAITGESTIININFPRNGKT